MENVILFHTEEFSFEKAKDKGGKEIVIISGNAQPLNEDSRNGVRYRPESVKKNYKTLEGVAFLNGHDPTKSLGHVEEVGLTNSHVTFRADVDPEETEYIRKVERKDIRHVSVGCMVENVEWNEEENIYICDVKEYVELSAVTVPGFANTSANKEGAMFLAEKLGDEKVVEKLKAAAKENADEEEKSNHGVEEKAHKERKNRFKKKEDVKSDEGDAESDEPDKDNSAEEAKDDDDNDDSDDDEEETKDDDEEETADDKDDDEDDEEEAKDDDDKDDDEEESAEEAIEKKTKELKDKEEELNSEADDEDEPTSEEKIESLENKVSELEGKNDELENRLAVVEAKVDALNEEEGKEELDKEEPDTSEEDSEIEPDKEEKFNSNKDKPAPTKQSLAAKEKALFGDSKKGEEIDMNKVNAKARSC